MNIIVVMINIFTTVICDKTIVLNQLWDFPYSTSFGPEFTVP